LRNPSIISSISVKRFIFLSVLFVYSNICCTFATLNKGIKL